MYERRLVTVLAGAFAVMTAILAVGGLFAPPLFILAVLFALVTYLIYEHASGRMLTRLYRGVERQAATETGERSRGGFGAGPREEWTPPRQEQRERARRQRVQQERRRRARQRNARGPRQTGQTRREASQVLGVDVDADEATVREAYRERIKDVHPDAADGSEAEFKRVQRAYETLTE